VVQEAWLKLQRAPDSALIRITRSRRSGIRLAFLVRTAGHYGRKTLPPTA